MFIVFSGDFLYSNQAIFASDAIRIWAATQNNDNCGRKLIMNKTKTVLITGANYGHTGFAIAERFAKEGWNIVLTCRKQETVDEAVAHLKEQYPVAVYGHILDLANKEDAEKLFAWMDEQGIFAETICLNAANLALGPDPSKGTPFFGITPEYIDEILQSNVVGNFRLAWLAAFRMRTHHKGAIVFISSNTVERPNANRVPYVTSKGGINGMSKSMAVDLGQYGIRSNVVMPGTIKTARWVNMGKKQISNGTMVPIGDISDFEDIANAAYYLGSDQSKNVTGTQIVVDGGMTAQLYPEILNRYRAEEIASMEDGI